MGNYPCQIYTLTGNDLKTPLIFKIVAGKGVKFARYFCKHHKNALKLTKLAYGMESTPKISAFGHPTFHPVGQFDHL